MGYPVTAVTRRFSMTAVTMPSVTRVTPPLKGCDAVTAQQCCLTIRRFRGGQTVGSGRKGAPTQSPKSLVFSILFSDGNEDPLILDQKVLFKLPLISLRKSDHSSVQVTIPVTLTQESRR